MLLEDFKKYNGSNFQNKIINTLQKIKSYLESSESTFLKIAMNLKTLKDNQFIKTFLKFDNGSEKIYYSDFYEFIDDTLGISKTRCSNLISVLNKCAIVKKKSNEILLKDKYTGYNFSQLVELLTVSDYNLKLFNADMTIKKIREIKDNIPTSEQKKNKKKSANKIEKICYLYTVEQLNSFENNKLIDYINELHNLIKMNLGKYKFIDKLDNAD